MGVLGSYVGAILNGALGRPRQDCVCTQLWGAEAGPGITGGRASGQVRRPEPAPPGGQVPACRRHMLEWHVASSEERVVGGEARR